MSASKYYSITLRNAGGGIVGINSREAHEKTRLYNYSQLDIKRHKTIMLPSLLYKCGTLFLSLTE
jgi:hypothetical protein